LVHAEYNRTAERLPAVLKVWSKRWWPTSPVSSTATHPYRPYRPAPHRGEDACPFPAVPLPPAGLNTAFGRRARSSRWWSARRSGAAVALRGNP